MRFAPAAPLAATREALAAAFARGDLATWPYDAAYAARAASPPDLLPGARTVVCIAVAYATAGRRDERGTGRVSNYAWSGDYHRTMGALLRTVGATIDELGGQTVVACDTKPIAERAFAARAGIGWVGKHTNLMVRGRGSYVFLGEIVTTLELEPDAPVRTTCGACTRCVQACPTGALRGDYTIDATRCISDLTQRRDAIPRALRPHVGTWIWGCDLCQEACPPTQRAPRTATAFAPRDEESRAPGLQRLLALGSAHFKQRYRGSAMGWRGPAVLRRNAAVALGNSLDRADVPALETALARDRHALVRAHAAWALGRIGSPRALASLRAAVRDETAMLVRDEIAAAIEAICSSMPVS